MNYAQQLHQATEDALQNQFSTNVDKIIETVKRCAEGAAAAGKFNTTAPFPFNEKPHRDIIDMAVIKLANEGFHDILVEDVQKTDKSGNCGWGTIYLRW